MVGETLFRVHTCLIDSPIEGLHYVLGLHVLETLDRFAPHMMGSHFVGTEGLHLYETLGQVAQNPRHFHRCRPATRPVLYYI